MPAMTSEQIAGLVEGELRGTADVLITGVRSLEQAGEADLSFVAKEKSLAVAARSHAGALITGWPVEGYAGAQIICADPELAVCRVLEAIHTEQFARPTGLSRSAEISRSATLGERVAVGSQAIVEDGACLGDEVVIYPLAHVGRGVRIGARTVIHPNVTIGEGTVIGSDCVVHPNCVIGDDGFRFIQRDGRSIKMVHIGSVRIGDGVEIGGLSSIDRGMVEDTVIGDRVKIDKHCHIAHNCHVGDDCVLAGGALLGGSVTLGRGVILGGRVGIADHLELGDGARVAAGSGVLSNVKAGEIVSGYPARPLGKTRRIWALESRLAEMHETLAALKEQVRSLKDRLAQSP